MKTIYMAMQNSDMTEGRGPMRPIALFWHKPDAEQAVIGKGVMGVGDGVVSEAVIYNSYEEFLNLTNEEQRKRALAKLTPREKQLLGL